MSENEICFEKRDGKLFLGVNVVENLSMEISREERAAILDLLISAEDGRVAL